MSSENPILMVDSGVGGIAYLDAFCRRNAREEAVYLADTAFFPYGQKTPDAVRSRVRLLFSQATAAINPKLAVLACNTASVVALTTARETVQFPIVGVVPAVKPAAESTITGHIAILATNRTVDDPYTNDLVRRFARHCRITRIGLPELVTAVEDDYCVHEWRSTRSALESSLTHAIPAEVDRVVLACTHFIHVASLVREYLPANAELVDSVDGVVRRMEWMLDAHSLRTRSSSQQDPRVFTTGPVSGRLSCLRARPWPPVTVTET